MTLILKSELLPLLLRAAGIIAAALSGIVGLKVLLNLPEAEGVVLIAVLGWMAFIPLGQFGYGRPVYGRLRRENVAGRITGKRIGRFLTLGRRQAVVASLTFCLLGFAYAARHSLGLFALTVAIFALGLAGLNSGIYQRDIAYALSREKDYEEVELCRRLVVLLGFLIVSAGLPVWAFGLLTFVVGTLTQQRLARILNPGPPTAAPVFEDEAADTSGLRSEAGRFMFFTTNELLLYNFPLIVFSLLGLASQIVFVCIWLRLFQLIVLPMRLGVDARMNRLVTAYFRGGRAAVWKGLLVNLAGSLTLTGVLLILLGQFKPSIFAWLGAAAVGDDPYLMASLGIWGMSNAVQHTFGSFTLSYGDGFAFASLVSLLTFVSTGLAFGVLQVLHTPIGQTLVATGVIYGLFALSCGIHVRTLLRRPVIEL